MHRCRAPRLLALDKLISQLTVLFLQLYHVSIHSLDQLLIVTYTFLEHVCLVLLLVQFRFRLNQLFLSLAILLLKKRHKFVSLLSFTFDGPLLFGHLTWHVGSLLGEATLIPPIIFVR